MPEKLAATRAKQVAEKVLFGAESIPQRLKPNSLQSTYVRAEARTLPEMSFSAACKSRVVCKMNRSRGFENPLPGLKVRGWHRFHIRQHDCPVLTRVKPQTASKGRLEIAATPDESSLKEAGGIRQRCGSRFDIRESAGG